MPGQCFSISSSVPRSSSTIGRQVSICEKISFAPSRRTFLVQFLQLSPSIPFFYSVTSFLCPFRRPNHHCSPFLILLHPEHVERLEVISPSISDGYHERGSLHCFCKSRRSIWRNSRLTSSSWQRRSLANTKIRGVWFRKSI